MDLVPCAGLRSGPGCAAKTGYNGDGNDGWSLEGKAMADWVLLEMVQEKWTGKAPMISNAGSDVSKL